MVSLILRNVANTKGVPKWPMWSLDWKMNTAFSSITLQLLTILLASSLQDSHHYPFLTQANALERLSAFQFQLQWLYILTWEVGSLTLGDSYVSFLWSWSYVPTISTSSFYAVGTERNWNLNINFLDVGLYTTSRTTDSHCGLKSRTMSCAYHLHSQ